MEHDEQVILFDLLRMHEEKYPILKYVFAIPNGGHRHKAVAAKMKAEGVKAGVWDVFVPVSKYEDGDDYYGPHILECGLWIEMKYGSNKLTENQESFRNALIDDYDFEVCYSGIEAANVIFEYLGISERVEG